MSERPSLPPEVERLIHRELDGLLTPDELRTLERAAAADPAVGRERAAWAVVRGALRASAVEQPVRPGLAASLAEAARRSPGTTLVGPWRRVSAAAAAVLVAVSLFGLGRMSAKEPQEVVANTKNDQQSEAAYRESLTRMGIKPDEIEALLEVGRKAERLRVERLESVKPDVDAIDRWESAEKWAKMSPASQKLWRAHDPRFVPPDAQGK